MILNDICEVYSGYALKEFNENTNGLPVIKIGNIRTDGTLDFKDCQYTSEKVNEKYYSQKEDVYVALSGATTGKIGILKTDDRYVINQRVGIIRKKDNEVPNEFIKYFLLRQTDRILQEAAGCAQPNISPKQLGQYEVPQYDKAKMDHIVAVLEILTNVIRQRNDELCTLDQLIKARFVELFGDSENNSKHWPVYKLDELCDVGSSKRIYQEEQTSEGIPFWRISDLVNKMDVGYANSGLFISQEKYDELKEKEQVPVAGDILVTSRGTLGRCYIISETDKFYFQDGMISWLSKYKHGITPLYIKHLFMTSGLIRQINGMQAGSTVAYLSITMLKKLDIMLPDSGVQLQFEEFVKQVDKSKVVVQKALEETQILFDRLMQEYFG